MRVQGRTGFSSMEHIMILLYLMAEIAFYFDNLLKFGLVH